MVAVSGAGVMLRGGKLIWGGGVDFYMVDWLCGTGARVGRVLSDYGGE